MKKPLVLCMSMALAVALAGCAATNNVEKPSQSPDITPAPTETVEPSPTEALMASGIPGSYIKDIQLGVARFGMEDASAEGAPDGADYRWRAERMWNFPQTTIQLEYSIKSDNKSQLSWGTFGARWDGIVDNDVFCDAAETYLSFIATMPYDTADQQKAKQWVSDNIGTVTGEQSATITIGDATFTLYGAKTEDGVPSYYWMDINPAQE